MSVLWSLLNTLDTRKLMALKRLVACCFLFLLNLVKKTGERSTTLDPFLTSLGCSCCVSLMLVLIPRRLLHLGRRLQYVKVLEGRVVNIDIFGIAF